MGDPLDGLPPESVIYLQTELPPAQIWERLPAAVRATIRERRLRLWALDAAKIARESASRAEFQIRMQGIALLGAFLRLTPFRQRVGLSGD